MFRAARYDAARPMLLPSSPLTPDAYAPYGRVIMASPHGEPGKPANQGTARRFDHLAALEDLRPGRAALNVSVFRATPWPAGPLAVALLEKHPASSQIFVPMNAARYLVIVARGGERPDLSTLSAFVASGTQGVSYHPGVWHHPLIALDHETDFACFAWEDGTDGDCTIVHYADEDRPVVRVDA
jgi:ureidoglycolate lyase